MVLGYNADLRCYRALTSTHGTTEVMGKSDSWYPTQSYSRKVLLQSMLVVPNTKPSAVKAAGAVKTAKAVKT